MFKLLISAQLFTASLAARIPRQSTSPWLDKSLSPLERAELLLPELTWDEKVGQMGGIRKLLGENATFNRTAWDSLYPLQHGILSYGSQLNSAQDVLPWANMVREEQFNRSKVPWVTVTDTVNSIYVTGGTMFPATLSLGSSWNLPLYEQVVKVLRDENMALGTHWVLSPELDIARDPRNGRVGEMYGEDPYLIGEFAAQFVKTMQERDEDGFIKVACTVKHFLFGESAGGINTASMYGGVNHLWNDLAAPYVRVLQEDPVSIMVAYASIDRVPSHMNTELLQGMLRGKMEFNGMLMSDAGGIRNLHTQSKVASSKADAAIKALKAGVQIELAPTQPAYFPALADYGNDTQIADLVDEAVRSMLEVKFAVGMFDLPLPTMEHLNQTLRAQDHLDINRRISEESIVLLENDGLLPISEQTKIAVVGPFADLINPGSYAPLKSAHPRNGVSLRQALETKFGSDNITFFQGVDINNSSDGSGITEAVSAVQESEIAVVVLGSLSVYFDDPQVVKRTDGEFTAHADLGFPGEQQQLLDAVLETGKPTILIISGGQAFVLNNSTMQSNAIIHSFLGGEYTGEALVDILTGEVNPSGKLTITMPQAQGAYPAYYDYLLSDNQGGYPNNQGCSGEYTLPCIERGGAHHAFGYGKSYTTFNISKPTAALDGETLHLTCTVSNTGHVTGQEVVQVYFRPEYSEIEFPVKKLIRFTKISLQPGEQQVVEFSMPKTQLGYWVDGEWQVESGNHTFWVGSSSKDQDLRNTTTVI